MSIDGRPSRQSRHRTRLAGYNYAQAGAYFLTLCVIDRNCYLGIVDAECVRLSVLGDIVSEEWERTPTIRPGVVVDAFVVMPNHLHAVVMITDPEEHVAQSPQLTQPAIGPHGVMQPGEDSHKARAELDTGAPTHDD